MSILIGKYEFDGPYETVTDLEDKQGLYAVLHFDGQEYELIHVAQADNISECIELSQSAYNLTAAKILLAACYTPRIGRRDRTTMVEHILGEFDELDDQECKSQPLTKTAS